MSTGTRRHRRARTDDTPPTSDQGEPVTQPVALESRETEGFLLHRLRTAASDVQKAQQQVQAAAAEAHRQDQIFMQLEGSEKELAAQLQQIQAEKQAAERRAQEARNASDAFAAQREEFKKQEADALRLCDAAGIQVEPPTPALPAGVGPAGPTRMDLTAGDPLTGPLTRFNEAHDEQEQQDAPSAGAA